MFEILILFYSLLYISKALAVNTTECGDWIKFKDEKCYKLFDKDETFNFDTGITKCTQLDKSATLVKINSIEEEEFITNFLFNETKLVDDVWIGLKRVNNSFKWLDVTDPRFTDWSDGDPSKDANRNCVEMKSPYSLYVTIASKWSNVPCNKKNIVICEKFQTWSISILEKELLEFKMDIKAELAKINKFENDVQIRLTEQNKINTNIIPVGFIYSQLPNQKSPQELFPSMQWGDISGQYANVFFRVIGDKSAAFNSVQLESQSSITAAHQQEGGYHNRYITIPPNGWSDFLYTGASSGDNKGTRFLTTYREVHPMNMAIKIWQRVN